MQFVRSTVLKATQSAVAWSLLAKGFRLLSGVLVLPLVVRKLPADHLGLWYVFLSLQGIASLFDLGFSPTVTRVAGYLWGGAKELRKFGLASAEDNRDKPQPNYRLLSGLVATMRLYYRLFGITSGAVMLLAGGAWIWLKTEQLPDAGSLRLCYAVFVFGGFLNATGDLWPALLSGINGVRAAQKILFGSALINLAIIVGGLLVHLGIWSLVLATMGAGMFIRLAGRLVFLETATSSLDRHSRPDLHLIATLWPTAWRSGLVSLGAFLVLSANTLICSAFLGLKSTASYGLSLNVITLLAAASSTFVQMKLPFVNQLRAINRTNDIVELWIQRTRLSIVVYIFGASILLVAGNLGLETIGAKTLLLPRAQLGMALLIFGLEMHHSLYAGLVISENQNPFVLPALLSGGATLLLSVLLTPRLGIWGMLLSQGLVQGCFNNWWTVYRAVRGLDIPWIEYWRRFLFFPIRI